MDGERIKIDSAKSIENLVARVNHAIASGWHINGMSLDDKTTGDYVYIDVALEREVPDPPTDAALLLKIDSDARNPVPKPDPHPHDDYYDQM